MLKKMNRKTAFLAGMAALISLLLLTAATYAWFTSNQSVSTTRANARTGEANVQLLVSEQGGAAFIGSDTAAITQVNQANKDYLLPVSTADLNTFLFNSATVNGYASAFTPLQNEEHIYHGVVYIKAVLTGENVNRRMAVYLEKSTATGGELIQGGNGLLSHAARLGISIPGQSPMIFSLSQQQNEADMQVRNTMLNGAPVEDGKVLTMANGAVTAVSDPSIPIESYVIDADRVGAALPERPLFVLDNGTVYPVDVYFYLEGCDPDCSDSISMDSLDLHLSFYGVVQS